MPISRRRGTPIRSTTAQRLGAAVDALIAEPSAEALQAARAAWLAARVPYQQTEAYPLRQRHRRRVGGQGERLAARRGADRLRRPELWRGDRREPLRRDQRHRQPELHALGRRGRRERDHARRCSQETLQEADAIEANVATGYHAIEFLLWGQDLNGTGPGAGNRPWTDYAAGDACTGGNCDRRAAYLKAATDLLLSDLEWMVAQWARRRRRARGGDGRSGRRGGGDPDRHGQPLLRRAGRRADAARADAARPGGGARLLLRQHLQQPLL